MDSSSCCGGIIFTADCLVFMISVRKRSAWSRAAGCLPDRGHSPGNASGQRADQPVLDDADDVLRRGNQRLELAEVRVQIAVVEIPQHLLGDQADPASERAPPGRSRDSPDPRPSRPAHSRDRAHKGCCTCRTTRDSRLLGERRRVQPVRGGEPIAPGDAHYCALPRIIDVQIFGLIQPDVVQSRRAPASKCGSSRRQISAATFSVVGTILSNGGTS